MKDLRVSTKRVGNKTEIDNVFINEEPIKVTKRFMKSWQMRFKLSDNVFKIFTPAEVFERISKVYPNDKIRYSIERVTKANGEKAGPRAMAVSNPNNPLIKINELTELLSKHQSDFQKNGEAVFPSYNDGFIRSRHVPRHAEKIEICGDMHENRYIIDTPVDGFGKPQAYIGLLREVCSNGAIAFSPAFRSEITIGKKNDSIVFAIERILQTFNSEEGYSDLHKRFESAGQSWASVHEAMRLHKSIVRAYQRGGLKPSMGKLVIGSSNGAGENVEYGGTEIMSRFQKLTGNLNNLYGLANIDSLSEKKQKTLPAGCRVYDLINFASEVATHHAVPSSAKSLQGYIGTMVSNEYDLEGTVEQYSDYRDFFIGDSKTADTLASLS